MGSLYCLVASTAAQCNAHGMKAKHVLHLILAAEASGVCWAAGTADSNTATVV